MYKINLFPIIIASIYTICFLLSAMPNMAFADNGEIINLYIHPLAIEVRYLKQNNTSINKNQLYLIYEEIKSLKKEGIQYESKIRPGIYRSIIDKAHFDNRSMNIYAQLLEDTITHKRDTIYSIMIDLTKNTVTSLEIVK